MPPKKQIIGVWRITQTEQWESDYLDMVAPAHITFQPRGQGDFAFGALQATLDWRFADDRFDFSFQGTDEGTEINGRGYAEFTGPRQLAGRIFFHLGDESGFNAVKKSQ